jgi:glycerate kinase
VLVGVGGTATVDGGVGLRENVGTWPAGVPVQVLCDVRNPLLGERGAARVFGPQKGASPDDVDLLERGLTRLADVVEAATGVPVRHRPGCGAAGGVGATALSYLGAELASGADLVLDLLGFDDLAWQADLVLTGEGRWDAQTATVKAPARVAARAYAVGIDVGVVAGVLDAPPAQLKELGIRAACALAELEPDAQRSMRDAAELVERASAVVLARWRAR